MYNLTDGGATLGFPCYLMSHTRYSTTEHCLQHVSTGDCDAASGWEAAVHAASQPPQPHAEGQQAWMLHRLGLMELLMHSAMSTDTLASMHHHAAPEQPPAVHVDDASSQCCEFRPRRRTKRSRGVTWQQGAKRARNYALIEIHVSSSAGPRKVNPPNMCGIIRNIHCLSLRLASRCAAHKKS